MCGPRHDNSGNAARSFGSLPMLDVVNQHHYTREAADRQTAWPELGDWFFSRTKRPWYMGEQGSSGEDTKQTDPKGYVHHMACWAPVMHGGAISTNLCWRVNYDFIPQPPYREAMRVFGNFVASQVPTLPEMDFLPRWQTDRGMIVGGYRSPSRAMLWVLNPAVNPTTQDEAVKPLADVTFELKGLATGAYTAAWFDTYTGKYLREDSLTAAAEGSKNSSQDYNAAQVIDGDANSYWETPYDTRGNLHEAWVVLDLGTTRKISRIRYHASDFKWMNDFDVQYSNDKTKWTTFEQAAGLKVSKPGWHELAVRGNTRYVRFFFRNNPTGRGKIGGLGEVEVYEYTLRG